ncbi:MAG: hypothetical protein L7H08_07530 [Vulcanisaeta sp.]|nr:hypothetical protein [Vulcanisaeta sp.]
MVIVIVVVGSLSCPTTWLGLLGSGSCRGNSFSLALAMYQVVPLYSILLDMTMGIPQVLISSAWYR